MSYLDYFIKNKTLVNIFLSSIFVSLILFKTFFSFDFSDEAQKMLKLYYLISENNLFKFDYNIHQLYFLILYPFLKIIYFFFNQLYYENFIIANKIIYFFFLLTTYFHLKNMLNKNFLNKEIEINILLITIFFTICSKIFFFTYDSLIVIIFTYFLTYISINNLNLVNSSLLTIIAGITHPIFGILIFISSLFMFNNQKKNISLLLTNLLITCLIGFVIFFIGIISIEDLFLSLDQSKNMINKAYFQKNKVIFISAFTTLYLAIRLFDLSFIKYFIKKYLILIFVIYFIFFIYLISSKYYLLSLSSTTIYVLLIAKSKNFKGEFFLNNKLFILDFSLISSVFFFFFSGNSIYKVDIALISSICITCLLILNTNSIQKNSKKIFFENKSILIILISLLLSSLYLAAFKSYRVATIFDNYEKLETRYGNIYAEVTKVNTYNYTKEILDYFNFNEITVIGSSPWIYLIDNYKPITKNIFFDINESLFFEYLEKLNTKNLIVTSSSKQIDKFLVNYECKIYNIPNNISEPFNKLLYQDTKINELEFIKICNK